MAKSLLRNVIRLFLSFRWPVLLPVFAPQVLAFYYPIIVGYEPANPLGRVLVGYINVLSILVVY